ncbi:hypothetical protein DM860_012953 [Cuscuta australis]|uniref:Uncharacterized protein n=1 Tax=Cuscuta australis TaxID=267555 RepID=A0A328DWC9_9ASTE|nr:hypothetical protein DM860_012953 [Cuscuta australis]
MSSYVKMESTSGGKMKIMKKKKKKSSRSMDLSHVQIISPHINNNSQQSNNNDDDDDQSMIIKANMVVKNEEGGKLSSESRRSNAAMGSERLGFEKNANTREFSARRHSTSERYCRVHDQNDHVPLSLEEGVQGEEDEEEESWRRKTNNKTSREKFLNVCKRFLRF